VPARGPAHPVGARDLLAQFRDEVVTAGAYEGEERAEVPRDLATLDADTPTDAWHVS
jgi:hypothetical protein